MTHAKTQGLFWIILLLALAFLGLLGALRADAATVYVDARAAAAGSVVLGSNRDASMPPDRSMYTVILGPQTAATHWSNYK
jgi:hypothetical protein